MNHYIVGCGGVCTYFLPSFLKTINYLKSFKKSEITLIDGDIFEEKNLERQVFSQESVGQFKSEALCIAYRQQYPNMLLSFMSDYITDSFTPEDKSMIIGFVDNHPARRDLLSVADRHKCRVIFAANSTIGAQAFYYDYKWSGTSLDPRIRYPEIVTTETGSPIRAAGCNTEQRLSEVPQTALANQFAAFHALHLWNFWNIESKSLDEKQSLNFWPLELSNTFSRLNTLTVGDLQNE
jgi:hypothetical protein